jgi:transitional endoplasmic reticulum ATPase
MARRLSSLSSSEVTLPALTRLWVLRMLVPLGAWRSFYGSFGYQNDRLAQILGMDELDMPDDNKKAIKLVQDELTIRYLQAERTKKSAKLYPALQRNIRKLSALVGLNDTECRILEFAVSMHLDRLLTEIGDLLGESISSIKLQHVLSVLLDIPEADIRTALSGQGMLNRSGLVTVDHGTDRSLRSKLDLISSSFADRLLDASADPISVLRDMVIPGTPAQLTLNHFDHITQSLGLLKTYLAHALATQRVGVNVFIHGAPGTGKTQLARVLSQVLGCEMFEVSSEDADGNPIDGEHRLRAYRAAQSFFANRQAFILFDEVEDVFNDGNDFFGMKSTAQKHKAWMNRMLEQNTVPTLWLSNSVKGIDPASIRRFDMVIELPVPPKKQRRQIVIEACGEMLTTAAIDRISASETLSPAVISRTASVLKLIKNEMQPIDLAPAMEHLISNTLSAQGHQPLAKAAKEGLAEIYDVNCVNANVDLQAMAASIGEAREARICLYGPPGTGKTAYGRWLAESLGMPLHVKRASDLMSKWVGGTERNIATAFKDAMDDGALLLIDEVDSFLQERGHAQHSWEITAVNEMLAQMERYTGVFIATTNLMQDLDQASLRRFELKVKFEYMNAAQAWMLLQKHCATLGLAAPALSLRARLSQQQLLTPGDFAAVSRQCRLRSIQGAEAYVRALEEECMLKKGHRQHAMGFL